MKGTLRTTAARLSLANEAGGIGTFDVDLETGIGSYSRELASMLGFPDIKERHFEDALARIHRADQPSLRIAFKKALDPEGLGQLKVTVRFVQPGGSARWISLRGQVEFFESASSRTPKRFLGACVDITELKLANDDLREKERWYRLALQASQAGAWNWDPIKDIIKFSESCRPLYGLPEYDPITLAMWVQLIHPADRDRVAQEVAQLLSAQDEVNHEFRINHPERGERWIVTRGHVERDVNGRAINVIGVDIDITASKQREAKVQLLLSEVNHRAKNLLSVVQVIAIETANGDPAEFISKFTGRIMSLAANQDLLIRNDWNGVDFDDLVRQQLAHFKGVFGNRIIIEGQLLRIRAEATQSLSMVLFELGTNAAKYGALSNTTGRVSIKWHLDTSDRFVFTWSEYGGPPVKIPVRQGFGWVVIQDVAAMALDAIVSLEFASEGLTCRLVAPADVVLEAILSTNRC